VCDLSHGAISNDRERETTQLQWNTKLTHAVLKDVISNDFE